MGAESHSIDMRVDSAKGELSVLTLAASAGLFLLLLAGCGSTGTPATEPPAPRAQPRPVTGPVAPPPERPLTQPEIAAVQTILAGRGYQPGPVDGKMGPKTAGAISRYQRDNGLEPDGLATGMLLRHLQAQPETAPEIVAVEAAVPSDMYPAGTRFVYSGSEIHTVTGTEGGRVRWRTSLGDTYVTGPDFGLPEIEWRSGTWRGVSESTLPHETTWPPNPGLEIHFEVTTQEWNEAQGEGAKRHVSDASWECGNEGSRRIEVPAGAFDTQKIVCERSPAPAGAWQTRVWYYDPSADHFVRRTDYDGAGLELAELELIGILPGIESSALRKGLEGAIHDALDRAAAGDTKLWRNPVGPERYLIEIRGDYDGPDGRKCRAYSVAREGSVQGREYPAVACRGSGSRRWVTPGLE